MQIQHSETRNPSSCEALSDLIPTHVRDELLLKGRNAIKNDPRIHLIAISGRDAQGRAEAIGLLRPRSASSPKLLRAQIPTLSRYAFDVFYEGLAGTDLSSILRFLNQLPEQLQRNWQVQHLFVSRLPVKNRREFAAVRELGFAMGRIEPRLSIDLKETGAPYSHLSKKKRYNLRRQMSIIRGLGGEVLAFYEPSDLRIFLDQAVPLSQATYQNHLTAGIGNSAHSREHLLHMSQAARACCFLLTIEQRPVAFQTGIITGRRYDLLEIGFDTRHKKLSPGTSLLLMSLEHLERRGVQSLDFGPGDAHYKRWLANTKERLVSLHHWQGLRGRIDARIHRHMIYSEKFLRGMVGPTFQDRVRKFRRNLLGAASKTKATADSRR